MRTIVKHNYIKAGKDAIGRTTAHARYIQFRPGKDRETDEQRTFFTATGGDVSLKRVHAAIEQQSARGTLVHKLIISPGVQGADVREYTREIMSDLESQLGLSLEWFAIRRDNTQNPHCHVILMGRDKNGKTVRLNRSDYLQMRQVGDAHLERHHLLDKDDRQRDWDEHPATWLERFFKASKAAASQFIKVWQKTDERREQRLSWLEQKNQESAALGTMPDALEMSRRQNRKALRDEKQKQTAWVEYSKPISIAYSSHLDANPVVYTWNSSLRVLRDLEREYKNGDPHVCANLSECDFERLQRWIKDQWREDKQLDKKAAEIEAFEVTYADQDDPKRYSADSTLEDLEELHQLHQRADIVLDADEHRALQNWISEKLESMPIIVQPDFAEPVAYNRENDVQALKTLAAEYARGEYSARSAMSVDDYRRLRRWIKSSEAGYPKDRHRGDTKRQLVRKNEEKDHDKEKF